MVVDVNEFTSNIQRVRYVNTYHLTIAVNEFSIILSDRKQMCSLWQAQILNHERPRVEPLYYVVGRQSNQDCETKHGSPL
jgi:hypothetical protein